ncbi:CHAT domain-containing protein [Streptosporangiaceae bacterium NEAU-GS5]|nr:CHAT domain-containing protein [Streptosporangiaceae bacterium NEAU-GS5]
MNTAAPDPAGELLRMAEADPARLRGMAAPYSSGADPALASVAERALGVAAIHLDDLGTAAAHLRNAMRLARRAGDPALAAEARIRLAFVSSLRGRPQQAIAEIDLALPDLHGIARARADVQRAAVFNHLGRHDDTVASSRLPISTLRRTGDGLWLQRALSNRAVAYGHRMEYAAAEADLREAESICLSLDLDLSLAVVQLNLGWVRSRRGDVPAALGYLDQAERTFRAFGAHQLGWLLSDRSELLMSVGLIGEAREAAEESVARLASGRRTIGLPEVRLLLARAAMLQGDLDVSVREAQQAVAEFDQQRRPEWAVLARYVALRSRVAAEPAAAATIRLLDRSAAALSAAKWPTSAAEAQLLAARYALQEGRVDQARRHLRNVGRTRDRGPALLRAHAWHATALLRMTANDRRGALTALRAGLRILDDYRATFGATDLRAHSAAARQALAELGLRIAMEGGRPRQILAWAEQGRASHLTMRPARPPDDPYLAGALTRLRGTVRAIQGGDVGGQGRIRMIRRQVMLERDIRDHGRRQQAGQMSAAAGQVSPARLTEALRDRVLIEYVELDGHLHAVCLARGRVSARPIGPAAPIGDLVDRIPFAIRRLASRRSRAGDEAAAAMLRHAAERLDGLLLRPLRREIGDRPLVVVPTGALQSLPWPILPSCAGRPVVVSPSAGLWQAATGHAENGGHVLSAAGPGLPGARAEAEAIAEIHAARPLVGAAATSAAVLAALDGARLAHLAAHGRINAANPLFSSLGLSDGPLTIYDLERLGRPPSMVVLAACDSGRSIVRAGDELLGLSATFLALGTRTIIAPVVSIPDAETTDMMIALHRFLLAGNSAAAALALAGQAAGDAVGAGFVCIGADTTLSRV